MIHIALVAACDRNNYGDVLLPIIFEHYIKSVVPENTVRIRYYGLTGADLREVGGRVVYPLSSIPAETSAVILAGGETLFANYISMHLSLNPGRVISTLERVMRRNRTSKRLVNQFLRKHVFHCRHEFPWLLLPAGSNQKVFYNCVGGAAFSKLSKQEQLCWKNAVEQSEMFSVRDRTTFSSMKSAGISSLSLVPDSAVIMASVFPEPLLASLCSEHIRKLVSDLSGRYYIVQANRHIGNQCIDLMCGAISQIDKALQMTAVLLPIGRASAHDDSVPLSAVHRRCPDTSILVENNNIYDVMYLIKHSRFYAGSSLHGAITAISFGVPHTALTQKSEKLINYINSWQTTPVVSADTADEMTAFAKKAVSGEAPVHAENAAQMKALVKEWFDSEIDRIVG